MDATLPRFRGGRRWTKLRNLESTLELLSSALRQVLRQSDRYDLQLELTMRIRCLSGSMRVVLLILKSPIQHALGQAGPRRARPSLEAVRLLRGHVGRRPSLQADTPPPPGRHPWAPGFRLVGMSSRSPLPSRLCVGLLSGTSVDAVEAVLCRIEGTGPEVRITLLAHVSRPFAPEFTRRVLAANDARALCELNFSLGEHFAGAALEVIARAGLLPGDVDVIGSHGQTVAHFPASLSETPSTLQLGEPAVIAERTGLPVVSDFRTRDVATGGEGAPLVPYLDWALFRKPGVARALQNLGGIGNVSVVSERLEDTIAFDTGPGNMVMDGLARRLTGGRLQCDLDGSLSRQGQVIPELLAELLTHPFLALTPPRSAGREGFGDALVERLWKHHGASRPHDVMATAVAFTVEATARAYERWLLPRFTLEAVYVSGGGTRNPVLMERLTERLAPLPVRSLDVLGLLPEGAKEAVCFALLANEHLSGTPANVPSATGAKRRVVLGKLTP